MSRATSRSTLPALPLLLACVLATCLGCAPLAERTSSVPDTGEAWPPADTMPSPTSRVVLYHGGPILTMAGETPETAEAIVTRGDRISFVGSLAEARRASGDDAREHDLESATLLPGFIDTHVHFGVQAQTEAFHVVEPWTFADAEAFLDHVAEVARKTRKGDWIVVFGFDRVLVPPFRNLTRADLDRASRDHPILVLYLGLHWATGNSRALELAGITRDTPTTIPGGGIFFKDEAGEPTGLMTESAVFELVHHLPPVDPDGSGASYRRVAEEMSRHGITTFAERATGASGGVAELNRYEALAHDPTFPQRIVATPLYQILGELEAPVAWDGFFQATQIKLLIDASLVGGTSATLEPQLDSTLGNLNYPREAYRRALLEAAAKGFSTTTHTMGDRAHRVLLEIFEALPEEVLAVGRHTLEHSALIAPVDVPRVAKLGLSVSHLTPMLRVHGDAMREHVYGPERTDRLYDSGGMLRARVNVALHSDAPIFATRPLRYVEVATTRETTSGRVLGEASRLSVHDALRGITINAAHHLSLEEELGSLEPGKLADLVLLERNPLEVELDAIEEIRVLRTIKGGVTYAGE